MRAVLALCLFLVSPVLAEGRTLAAKLPEGASAFVEINDLNGRIDAVVKSPLFKALAENAMVKAVLASPDIKAARAKFDAIRNATGWDELGLVRAVGGTRIAIAMYGGPARTIAIARMRAADAERVMAAAEK